MKQYQKYLISQTEQFDVNNFSFLHDEIDDINEKTNNVPPVFKAEMIIAFLKDHSLNDEWVAANPQLAELVNANALSTGGIEALFKSSNSNPVFQQDLVNYLKEKFTASHSTVANG